MTRLQVRERFEGKSVAVVGSGPGCLNNRRGYVDGHDVVVRVNNYHLTPQTGGRTDVFYSFFGNSIKKTVKELKEDGVKLCICKCPDAHAIKSEWHRRNRMMTGVDFQWIYKSRENWWFCDTFIPEVQDFLAVFRMLGGHIPTTGFSAILDVLSFAPASVYITGFDFFRSKVHNVYAPWKPRNNNDPVGHVPERELRWLAANIDRHPIKTDATLERLLASVKRAA